MRFNFEAVRDGKTPAATIYSAILREIQQKKNRDGSLAALRVYEVGKPLVIEEIFPLGAGVDETATFIEKSRSHADGWISFYWGTPPEKLRQSKEFKDALLLDWLERFQKRAPGGP